MHIAVCICTYQRPGWLKQLLLALGQLETKGEFTYSIVVADNDSQRSAEAVIREVRPTIAVEIAYAVEPARSISLVRNLTISMSHGEGIAFIDDDEFPDRDWLYNHYKTLREHGAAGTLGPVRPYFNEQAPAWIKRSGLYDRPEHPTGFLMNWRECRTGNVLFERRIITGISPVFRTEFATGSGDMDFFRRMILAGHKFVWCNEAPVFEHVPPNRWDRKILVRRALLRGRNSFRHPEGRAEGLLKALVAVPAYTLALPFMQLRGHHLFMRYLVKLCHHAGHVFGALGIDPIKQRDM